MVGWIEIVGAAGDIASIIVAISAVGGALWFGMRRGISYLREFVAKPSVIRGIQWGLSALGVGLMIASVFLFVELRIQEIRQIPADAVIAVDRSDCPPGWSTFEPAEDRFVLGVSPERPYRMMSGSEQVSLENRHLPSHSHDVTTLEWGHTVNGNGAARRLDVDDGPPYSGIVGTLQTAAVGEGEPHENMPPFIALPLCIKKPR